jgi:hypothetical protein
LPWYHFDADDQGWYHNIIAAGGRTFTAGWVASPHNGNDPQDSSAGALEIHFTASGQNEQSEYVRDFEEGLQPIAATGVKFYAGFSRGTGPNPTVRMLIIYSDDSHDDNWYIGGINGWSVLNAAVSSGNVGKYIKRLIVRQDVGAGAEGWMNIDNAHLL